MALTTNPETERRATYAVLSSLFLSIFTAFTLRLQRKQAKFELQPFDLALLGLATFRLGRLAAFDKVTDWLREPFTETKLDESGAGKTVVPEGQGARRAIGELISCPICAGTWIASALVYGLEIAPRPTRVFLAIMGATGLGEILNSAAEALQWTGEAARKQSGS